jgi:flavin reductase (DIM6/NTAB) family NADH-FMN oxidoreductase RutF
MIAKEIAADAGVIIPLIEKGAFLTVQANASVNTMTIGWGMLGICWRKPVMTVAVRNSRYTFQLMERADSFTLSMPSGNLRDEIFYCGTTSGKEVNKFEECGLKTAASQQVSSPIIDTAGIHMECRIIYKNAMDPDFLIEEFHALYPKNDYHTLYYGQIKACYELG